MALDVELERYFVNLPKGVVTSLKIVSLNKTGEVSTTALLQIIRENTNPYSPSNLSSFHQNSKSTNYVAPSTFMAIRVVESGVETPVDLGFIMAYTKIVDRVSHAKTTYRNALDDPYFRTLYSYDERDLPYIENNVPITRRLMSGPCMQCGLVLPWDYLTIDHQKPQSNGQIGAVLKAFRVCGLTVEGPKGHKGSQLFNHLTNGTKLGAVPTKLNRPSIVSGDPDKRNTLSLKGAMIYTLLKAAGTEAQLKTSCMNSLMNLAPLCLHCNSSKNNN